VKDANIDAVRGVLKRGVNATTVEEEDGDMTHYATTQPRQSVAATSSQIEPSQPTQSAPLVGDGTLEEQAEEQSQPSAGIGSKPQKKFKLTDFAPDPGYFLAGAIAGGVSRTATAPLDRLKVYLLVNTTSSSETAAAAIKQGRPIAAVKNALRPISDAVKDLFRNGGVRSFFAGELTHSMVGQYRSTC
jgi:solute carrier family 25 phosphate transporter 23/24/25/41